MAEEVRFFLRTALYSAVISVVYWFSSREALTGAYDWAGTIMLLFTALAAGAVVAVLVASARRTTSGLRAGGSLPGLANRLVGFTDPAATDDERPLSAGLEPIPTRSPWPAGGGPGRDPDRDRTRLRPVAVAAGPRAAGRHRLGLARRVGSP